MFQVSSHFILSCIPHCSGHTPPIGFRWDTQTDAVISILVFLPGEGQIPDSDGICHNVLSLATCFYSNDFFLLNSFPEYLLCAKKVTTIQTPLVPTSRQVSFSVSIKELKDRKTVQHQVKVY